MAEEKEEAPWSVEVPKSQLSFLQGPNDTTLKRLCAATGCELEVARQPKKRLKKISYGGQDQYLDDDGGEAPEAMVKVFIRGPPKRRLVAAEVLRGVADGDDPEDHAAIAEGAVVFPHELQHPDREAWARWRLMMAAHEHNARAHLGRKTVRLASKSGAAFSEEAADLVRAAAEQVLTEAERLVEIRVEALDRLEPEEAPTDPAIVQFADQHGVIVRVCDQDDNAVSETITVRLFGPPDATADAAALVRLRFIDGKATASLLQPPGEVQGLEGEKAALFADDLRQLESERKVCVHKGPTALLVSGDDATDVAEAAETLRQMLQFYLEASFHFVSGVSQAAAERLLADLDLGVLIARGDTVACVDVAAGTVWVGGRHRASVQRCIDAAKQEPATPATDQPAQAPRRRMSALSVHSVSEVAQRDE